MDRKTTESAGESLSPPNLPSISLVVALPGLPACVATNDLSSLSNSELPEVWRPDPVSGRERAFLDLIFLRRTLEERVKEPSPSLALLAPVKCAFVNCKGRRVGGKL